MPISRALGKIKRLFRRRSGTPPEPSPSARVAEAPNFEIYPKDGALVVRMFCDEYYMQVELPPKAASVFADIANGVAIGKPITHITPRSEVLN